MPTNHLILCRPLLLLPSIFPSIRVCSNESVLHIRWPKYWSFSFKIVCPMHIQDWFPLAWPGWISLQSKGLSRVFSNTTVQNINSLVLSFLYSPTLTSIHDYWKKHSLIRSIFVVKVMSLLFNMLSRLIVTFLPRSKCLNFMAAVTISSDFGAQKNKVCHCLNCFPIYLPWSDATGCHDLSFWMLSF